MAYSDFDLEKVTTDFALIQVNNLDLFPDTLPVQPSDYLREWAGGVRADRHRFRLGARPRRVDHLPRSGRSQAPHRRPGHRRVVYHVRRG